MYHLEDNMNIDISTKNLRLRPFTLKDAIDVLNLCNNLKLYENTLNLPYPYTLEDAKEWINYLIEYSDVNRMITLAIEDKSTLTLYGCIGASISKIHKNAEIGYWLGERYWGKGIMTEVLTEFIKFLFENMNLNRIYGGHFLHNPASGKVMEKSGMKKEGISRQVVLKNGKFYDIVNYAILKEDFGR